MIQRRVKWKKGVTVENGCVQARKGLGNSKRLVVGVWWVSGGLGAAVYFKVWRGNIAQWLRSGA